MILFQQGFTEFLPQLVDQMASASLEPDTKDQKISYEVIRVEDGAEVVKLLKETFFKVRERKLDLFAVFIAEGLIFHLALFFCKY